MTTPNDERPEPTYVQPSYQMSNPGDAQGRHSYEHPSLPSYNVNNSHRNNSSDEGTVVGDAEINQPRRSTDFRQDLPPNRPRAGSHLTVETQYEPGDPLRSITSASQTREQAHRLDDDLELLKIERQISRIEEEEAALGNTRTNDSTYRSKSRKRDDHVDEFDVATNPVHEKAQVYKPVENPATGFGKVLKKIHQSNFLIRWFTYIAPVTLIILIPLLLGALKWDRAVVGGVYLLWFCIWLEIVWLSLWAGRLLAKCLPFPIGLVASFFTNNAKKWRDMGKQLELPATLFFWWLAIEVSFLPTMTYHQRDHPHTYTADWMGTMNKVLVSFFVGAILNFVEKIIIQLIAISFHLRTYADRIEINKFQIGSLTKLYTFSKAKIAMEDSEFEQNNGDPGSGARTPGQVLAEAAKTGKQALSKFGDVAGKVAGDFTGKKVIKSTHPQQVVLALLSSTSGAQVLARRLYRTFAREDTETVVADDLRPAFENDDEANAAFTMFDKDMNGDISMEELEAVCVEIGRERKAITASLKDLDSVVSKLDDVLFFIVAVIFILVLISLLSTSAAGVLTSAGSTVLALSWLFAATAQEFLQSIIFVFVKHPFDVGDRVSIYGNTGSQMKGDDYFVKEIALLYTEFKKMEGQIVQAPNSYLNTLFILNMRRSGGLAEAVPIVIRFGTTIDQIDALRQALTEFVLSEKREYQGKILTELREVTEAYSLTLNVVFFYKSNWQNELLRLQRRNKFICAMMVAMQNIGIEGPYRNNAGWRSENPMYLHTPSAPPPLYPGTNSNDNDNKQPSHATEAPQEQHDVRQTNSHPSILRREPSTGQLGRPRHESVTNMSKHVDFSLGMKNISVADFMGEDDDYRSPSRYRDIIREVNEENDERRRSESQTGTARSTSRDNNAAPSTDSPQMHGGIFRRSTTMSTRNRGDSISSQQTHRNRFLGRLGHTGRSIEMPRDSLAEEGQAGPMDPRSGQVSSQAVRVDSQTSRELNSAFPPAPIDMVTSRDFEMNRVQSKQA